MCSLIAIRDAAMNRMDDFGNHFKPQETELHSVFLRHFYVSPY